MKGRKHMGRGRRRRKGMGRGRRHVQAHPDSVYLAESHKEYIVEKLPTVGLLPCLGIYPKSRVKKSYRYRFGGPVVLTVGNREVAVGKDIASHIIVKEAE